MKDYGIETLRKWVSVVIWASVFSVFIVIVVSAKVLFLRIKNVG